MIKQKCFFLQDFHTMQKNPTASTYSGSSHPAPSGPFLIPSVSHTVLLSVFRLSICSKKYDQEIKKLRTQRYAFRTSSAIAAFSKVSLWWSSPICLVASVSTRHNDVSSAIWSTSLSRVVASTWSARLPLKKNRFNSALDLVRAEQQDTLIDTLEVVTRLF